MVNSIQSIEPLFEGDNIPPKPKEVKKYEQTENYYTYTVENQEELDLWEKLYGKKESI